MLYGPIPDREMGLAGALWTGADEILLGFDVLADIWPGRLRPQEPPILDVG